MRHKKHTLVVSTILAMSLLLGVFGLSGCAEIATQNNAQVTYNMQTPLDAAQYSSFISKQINAVTNQLSTNILIAQKISTENYPITDALNSATASLQIISSARNQVDVMIPPNQYADTRENMLRMMLNAESDLTTYIDELKKDNCSLNVIKELQSLMQTDFIALTAEFNIYYE